MSYATLMVYVDVDGTPTNRVAVATGLSDKFKATLIGLCALAIRPLFLDEKFNSDRVTGADENMKLKVARKGDWFRRLAHAQHGRSFPGSTSKNQKNLSDSNLLWRSQMQTVTTVGLDIAKSAFQVHCVDVADKVIIRRQFKRRYVLAFFQKLPPCLIGIEACASSHYWSRELQAARAYGDQQRDVKILLANSEPSTHRKFRQFALRSLLERSRH
jgi:transposase